MVRSPHRVPSNVPVSPASEQMTVHERAGHCRSKSWPAAVSPSPEEVQRFALYLEQSLSTGLRADSAKLSGNGRQISPLAEHRDGVTLGRLVDISLETERCRSAPLLRSGTIVHVTRAPRLRPGIAIQGSSTQRVQDDREPREQSNPEPGVPALQRRSVAESSAIIELKETRAQLELSQSEVRRLLDDAKRMKGERDSAVQHARTHAAVAKRQAASYAQNVISEAVQEVIGAHEDRTATLIAQLVAQVSEQARELSELRKSCANVTDKFEVAMDWSSRERSDPIQTRKDETAEMRTLMGQLLKVGEAAQKAAEVAAAEAAAARIAACTSSIPGFSHTPPRLDRPPSPPRRRRHLYEDSNKERSPSSSPKWAVSEEPCDTTTLGLLTDSRLRVQGTTSARVFYFATSSAMASKVIHAAAAALQCAINAAVAKVHEICACGLISCLPSVVALIGAVLQKLLNFMQTQTKPSSCTELDLDSRAPTHEHAPPPPSLAMARPALGSRSPSLNASLLAEIASANGSPVQSPARSTSSSFKSNPSSSPRAMRKTSQTEQADIVKELQRALNSRRSSIECEDSDADHDDDEWMEDVKTQPAFLSSSTMPTSLMGSAFSRIMIDIPTTPSANATVTPTGSPQLLRPPPLPRRAHGPARQPRKAAAVPSTKRPNVSSSTLLVVPRAHPRFLAHVAIASAMFACVALLVASTGFHQAAASNARIDVGRPAPVEMLTAAGRLGKRLIKSSEDARAWALELRGPSLGAAIETAFRD